MNDFVQISIEILLQIVTIILDIYKKVLSMKHYLLTALIFFGLIQSVQAAVIIDYQGDTVVRQKNVERNLLLRNDSSGIFNIAIKPLDNALRGSNGVDIPLNYVYINNTREDVYLQDNFYSNLFTNLEMNGIPQNITAKIRDYGMVPAGTYSLNFEIQATNVDTEEVVPSPAFMLQIVVPVVQDINLNGETPKITIDASDAFTPQKKVANETSPTIQINSNADWELSVNTDNIGETKGNYYIRTITATNGVSERLQERVLLEPNKEIIIAKGKAPADNESVTVEFSVESKSGEFLPAGNYENRIRYILREEE